MKLLIEMSGGVITNIVATQECRIYIVDHDEIKKGGMLDEGELAAATEPQQPYLITYEEGQEDTPNFDNALENSFMGYFDDCPICGGLHRSGFEGDCRDDAHRGPRKEIIGYYSIDGYRIEDNLDGEVLYVAGNNPLESTSHVDPEIGLPLATLKEYCERTGQEMAAEMSAVFVGAFEAAEEGEG